MYQDSIRISRKYRKYTHSLGAVVGIAERLDHLAGGVTRDARAGIEHDGPQPAARLQWKRPHAVR